jgi:hypothetical protein
MGLRHLEQVGGGVFLGMTLTLDQARAPSSLSPINAETRAVMLNLKADCCRFVCAVPDSDPKILCILRV